MHEAGEGLVKKKPPGHLLDRIGELGTKAVGKGSTAGKSRGAAQVCQPLPLSCFVVNGDGFGLLLGPT